MVNKRGVGPYTDNDPGIRRDNSVDESGNPKANRRSVFDEVERNSGDNRFSAPIRKG